MKALVTDVWKTDVSAGQMDQLVNKIRSVWLKRGLSGILEENEFKHMDKHTAELVFNQRIEFSVVVQLLVSCVIVYKQKSVLEAFLSKKEQ